MGHRALACMALWAAGFGLTGAQPYTPAPYVWNLPKDFPRPRVPATNQMSAAKAELGRFLFYDKRLSENRTQACASCHVQAHAFADVRDRAVGSTGERHPRGSMSLVNVAYAGALTWSNPSLNALEEQALVPMFGDQPVELGLKKPGLTMLARLRAEPRYRPLFERAFGADPDPFTVEHVTQAIASFERTIISARSPYDRYHNERDDNAMSPAARRGEDLFFTSPQSCFRCHGGFNFSGAIATDRRSERMGPEFRVNRLFPPEAGTFKAPTLRNIALTAPYMHDGSIATLEQVLARYQKARGFTLTDAERDDLLAFLHSLTDEALLSDPRWANPWPDGGRP